LKIAYIVTRADPIGGVQIHIKDLAAAAQAEGHDVTVLAGGSGPFIDLLRAQNTPTVVLRHLTVPVSPLGDIRALSEIRRILADLRPDLLALHSAKAGVLGRLAGRSLGIPAVLTAHGWTFTPGFPRVQGAVYRHVERLVGPLTKKIIAVSEFDRRLALEAGIVDADRIVTVHNGIPDIAPQLRADPARTPTRLVMVARFSPQKDHQTLLRALSSLQDLTWELDLIGDGPLIDRMKSLAASLGLTGRVRFLGQRMDVDRLLAQAQVSILATNWEGFPLSILESMRAGLPVIASSVGGVEEAVVDAQSGYLVARGDVGTLRDRIRTLLEAPDLRARLGANARSLYEQHFSLEVAVRRTLDVYHEVAAGTIDAEMAEPRSAMIK
jgi:glycosyltransferase involved in cell wall biosynthesis